MTTTPAPDAASPAWKALCDSIDTITDPGSRDLASDALCEAYSLGITRGEARVRDAAARQVTAYRAGTDQVLTDMRTIRERLLAAHLCDDCHINARAALDDLGPLINQTKKIIDTEEAAARTGCLCRAQGSEDLLVELLSMREDRDRLTVLLKDADAERATIRSAVPECMVSDGLVDDVEALARRAAMLGPVLRWRDHTAAALGKLLDAAEVVPGEGALHDAARAGREVLQLDPEKTYGFTRPVDQDAEHAWVNTSAGERCTCEVAAPTVSMLATEPARLGARHRAHSGRSWTGHDIEDTCPCPQEPCGLVDLANASLQCSEHPVMAGRTIRQSHKADQCPGGPNATPAGPHAEEAGA